MPHYFVFLAASATCMDGELIPIPVSVTLSSQHTNGGEACYAVFHKKNGDMLIGAQSGLWSFSKSSSSMTKKLTFNLITAVVEHHNATYILHNDNEMCKVEMCLPDMISTYVLFEFRNTDKKATKMSVSDEYVMVFIPTGNEPRRLITYSFSSKQCKTTPLVDVPQIPHFLPDGHLLTSGFSDVSKHSIEDGELTTIWTCKGLDNVVSLCSDPNGLIYAATFQGQKSIYIISPAGKLSVHGNKK